MKTLQITDVNARKLYSDATVEFRATLEDTFGKDFFSTKVTDRVKTYEDACRELDEEELNETALVIAGFTQDEMYYRRLKTVTKALNEGWEPDWSDGNQQKWAPYFRTSSGFAFSVAYCYCSLANAGCGSRLCFRSKELAEYAGRQFTDLYKGFILK